MDDEKEFVIVFPLWAIGHKDIQNVSQDVGSIVTASRDSQKILLLCTDQELAQQFIQQSGSPDLRPIGLRNAAALAEFLEEMEATGVSHVKLDTHESGPLLAIRIAIEAARKQGSKTDGETDSPA